MRVIASVLCLALATPTLAQAQDVELLRPEPRQGAYLGGGIRSGYTGVHSDTAGFIGLLGGAFTLRVGQMANEWLGFGLLAASGGGANQEWGGGYGGLSLELQLKPLAEHDLAVRLATGVAGMGIGRVDEAQKRKDDPSGAFGALYTVGVSWDLFVSAKKEALDTGGLAFTPFIEVQLLPTDTLTTWTAFAGIELTYWFGLARNRLELPTDRAFDR